VMLDGIEVIETTDSDPSDFPDSADFEDSSPVDGSDLPDGSIAQQRLQLVRRELFEIRDLLSAAH